MANYQWCSDCSEEIHYNIVEKQETYNYKGETFEVTARVAICPECGIDLPNSDLDGETMEKVRKLYMERSNLTTDDIKNIRNQYGLSMELFAKILGWGKATIVRYESGNYVPASSHLSVLKRLKDNSEELINYYEQNKEKFTEREQKKINKVFENNELDIIERNLLDTLRRYYIAHENTIESGYQQFSIEKLSQMVIFFSQDGINKTVLLKKLFYSDFLNYKRYLISISGIPYVKLRHGPVPMKYNILLDTLQVMNYINIEEECFNEYTRITVNSIAKFNSNIFKQYELDVLNFVKDYFENYGSVEISTFSHKEDAWTMAEINEVINYDYANSLQIN